MQNKRTDFLCVILISIGIAALIMPLYFIFTSIPSLVSESMVYAYDETFNGRKNYLKMVSADMMQSNTNNSSASTPSPITTTNTTTVVTQIPEAAKGPAIPQKGYLVEEIRDNLYWVTDGGYDTMFLVTDKGVVAIDAPPSIGQNYLKAIAEVTDKLVTHVIYSHAHLDHIGAAGMFPKNATYIAHQDTGAELQRAVSVADNDSMVPPVPTVTFPNNYTLQIGNQTLNLDYYGTNHMPGNLFIYSPNQKVLMLVDIIFPGWIPFPYLAIADDPAAFIRAHDIALKNYDFDTLVAGHLTRLGTRDDVVIQKEFISDLEKAATKANSEVLFTDIAKEVGSFDNPWLLVSKHIDAKEKNCVESLLPKWQSKLGGAEQFMSTQCFTMTEEGMVDPTLNALLQSSSTSK